MQQVDFVNMLRAIWSTEGLDDTKFDALLDDSTSLCNSPGNDEEKEILREIKTNLIKYCDTKTEQPRYIPLVNALNAILEWKFKDPNLIFVVNDPAIVKCGEKFHSAKRKPDIILISVDYARQLLGNLKPFTFAQCCQKLPKRKPNPAPYWADVYQSWEVRHGTHEISPGALRGEHEFDKPSVREAIEQKKPSVREATEQKRKADRDAGPSKKKRKLNVGPGATGEGKSTVDHGESSSQSKTRKCKAPPPPSTKTLRQRVDRVSNRPAIEASGQKSTAKPKVDAHADDSKPPTLDSSLPVTAAGDFANDAPSLPKVEGKVQCAHYAMERLHSSPSMTHTTIVYLIGNQLELIWYDAQGRIKSNAMNMIDELPSLVALISVLGSCPSVVEGVGKAEKDIAVHGAAKHMVGPNFQLTGRRTFVGDFTANDALNATYHVKIYWPEITRTSEREIVDMAKKRAALLPGDCPTYVTNHLPCIKHHGDVEGTTTSLIRRCLELCEIGARAQRWIISEKLEPLKAAATKPEDFYRAYWEIVRCHYLLWITGIAHGDISFSNCMFNSSTKKGILNDFDLSTIMDPGIDTPSKSGQEHTGTKPFMALELLTEDGYSGNVQRRYRHELESFTWVLAWAAGCVSVNPIQEKIVAPFDGWVGVDHITVREKKIIFLYDWKVPSESWLPVATQKSLRRFMAVWQEFYSVRSSCDVWRRTWTEPNGRELLVRMVEAAGAMPEEIKDDWLKEEVKLHVAEVWPEWQKQHKKT